MSRPKRVREISEYTPLFRHFVNLICNRIKINGMPEEIDEKFFIYHVLLDGRILFFTDNGKYHAMWFSGRGERNEYYIQKERLVTNPWVPNEKHVYNENNSVIVYSDVNAYLDNCDAGLYDFVNEYVEIINAIDKSIKALAKNSKVIAFITGSDTGFVQSARVMINKLFEGDECIGIMEESLVDNIKVNPIADKMDYKFSELTKARQYYISDFYQKIGIANNQNMKKERLTDNESQLIENVAGIDFTHIIDNLNFSISKVNDLFNLNISFSLNEDDKDDKEKEEIEDEPNSGLVDETEMGDGDGEDGGKNE